ncbi:MAG: DUF2148 domain-containing protein [Desulfobacteraceae bacterium]|nr:DUF2148 domain-containing protein [Desulfobacteraceae bacterium]
MGHLIGKAYCLDHLIEVAKSIVLAIHKAPQITGKTQIAAEIIWGEDLTPIVEVMGPVSQVMRYVKWDYETIKHCCDKGESPVIIAIGGKISKSNLGWNCGSCGFDTCAEFNAYSKEYKGGGQLGGPSCNWKMLDWAMACDWACAAAWQYRVDNRIMGSLGFALNALGFMPDMDVKLGLALGPPRDMVYYSREEMHKGMSYEMDKQDMVNCVPTQFAAFPGGGAPMYKTKNDWWAPPEFMGIGYSEQVMEVYQKVLFEQVPEIVVKHADKIAERYKKKP